MSPQKIANIDEQKYSDLLYQAVTEITVARTSLARQVSSTVMSTYWNIGKLLFAEKLEGGYGSGIINRLSVDLKLHFPDMGLSPRNLWNMKRFYERYHLANEKLLRSVAVLPWRSVLLLLDKVVDNVEAEFYAYEAVEKGWTRDLLLNAIKMDMYAQNQQLVTSNNFPATLPAIQAEYANDVFKCSYNLGFLGVTEPIKETDLEKRLVEKIKIFILELGKRFSYVGNQYRLEWNGKEYFVDMLFFHRDLRSLVAIELKIGCFKPEYIGKMNLYLSLLDKIEKREDENQSIGIILCADKDHLEVELALQDVNKPIGVALYQLLPRQELQTMIIQEIRGDQDEKDSDS